MFRKRSRNRCTAKNLSGTALFLEFHVDFHQVPLLAIKMNKNSRFYFKCHQKFLFGLQNIYPTDGKSWQDDVSSSFVKVNFHFCIIDGGCGMGANLPHLPLWENLPVKIREAVTKWNSNQWAFTISVNLRELDTKKFQTVYIAFTKSKK